MSTIKLGKVAYEAYAKTGVNMQSWDQLNATDASLWIGVAAEVVNSCMKIEHSEYPAKIDWMNGSEFKPTVYGIYQTTDTNGDLGFQFYGPYGWCSFWYTLDEAIENYDPEDPLDDSKQNDDWVGEGKNGGPFWVPEISEF